MNAFPKTTLGFYFKYGVKPFWLTLVIWFILAISWRLSDGILLPCIQKIFLNTFEQPVASDATWISFALPVILLMVGTIVIAHLVHVFDDILWIRLRVHVFNHLSEILHNYVHNQSIAFWSKRIIGKVNEQINYLAKGFEFLVTISIVFAAIMVVLLNFGLILQINTKIALCFAASILFYCIHCSIYLKKMNKANKVVSVSYSGLMGKLIDSLSNFMIVKLFAGADYEKKFVKSYRKKYADDKIYAGMITRVFWAIPTIMWGLLFGLVLILCVKLYLAGEISVADIVFIMTVNIIIMGNVSYIVMSMPGIAEIVGSASQSYTELMAKIDIQDIPNAKDLVVKHGQIEFKNISFSYDTRRVLNDLSLTIQPGEKVGLVGLSGAGKTTLVNLLMRLYDPKSGAIMIDGQNIHDVTQKSLRENIAFIPQDISLFNRSVKDNIAYGFENASIKAIKLAAHEATADRFIENMPDKYDTIVGERGLKMSGGQRQRIAIARAFLKDAPILILDEATSALDSATEIDIQKSLEKLSVGRTTVVIAHRLSTLRNMDRIVVLNKGKIIEIGSHRQLIRNKNGLYYKLWNMQSDGFIQEQ